MKTSTAREIQAGLTTFAAMAYILAVNPMILSDTGMDKGTLITVTALAAATGTLLMALLDQLSHSPGSWYGVERFFLPIPFVLEWKSPGNLPLVWFL